MLSSFALTALITTPRPPLRTAAPSMFFRSPPKEIVEMANPDWRYKESAFTVAEVSATWAAFEDVYGSREKALEASRKNQAVLRPDINDPATIRGAHKVLVGMCGKERAADIIERNPGVLACPPAELAKIPLEDIERTAGAVSWFDGLDDNVKQGIPFLTWFLIVGTLGSRFVICSSRACGSVDDWDLQGGFGPQAVRAVQAAISSIQELGLGQ